MAEAVDFNHLLSGKSKTELESMQNDEDEINRLVLESEVIKRLKVDKEMVLAANRSLADSNLEQRPILERNKNELGGMYETLNEVQEEFRQKSKSLKTTRDVYTLDSASAVIQAAASEAEMESEDIASRFTNGEISIDDFLKDFLPMRQKSHGLKFQSDKLIEEMNNQNSRNSQNYRAAPQAPGRQPPMYRNPPGVPPYQQPAMPYPVAGPAPGFQTGPAPGYPSGPNPGYPSHPAPGYPAYPPSANF